jgi:ribosomal protein L11 methyltransferase
LADHPALDLEFLSGQDPFLRDRVYALLDDFDPIAIQEDEEGDHWRVFFASATRRDAADTHLRSAIAGHLLSTAVDVADEDWARRSQEGLRAIHVGGLIVAPPWDVPRRESLPVIVIDPSTGFGTGHHATTRLCLRLLQQLELRGAHVIDVGTGSGVLALAAWKLGAAEVVAVDNDPDALDNARANIARNGAGAAIDIIRDDLAGLILPRGDVILANLTAAALVRHAGALHELARDEAYFVLSGFSPEQALEIEPAFTGLTEIARLAEGEWAALCLRQSS